MSEMERYGLRPQVAAALNADVGGAPEEKAASLTDLLHILRKRKGTILGLAGGTFALTAVLTLLQPPVYEAKTRLLIQSKQQQGLGSVGSEGMMPMISDMMGMGAARSVGTEMEVLQSDTLVNRAIVEEIGRAHV